MLNILTSLEISVVLCSKQRCSPLGVLLLMLVVLVAADRGHCSGECSDHHHATEATRSGAVAAGSLLQVLAHTVHLLQRQVLHLIFPVLALHHAERSFLYHDFIFFFT